MRFKCAISNLDISCTHFPGSLHSREFVHPVFAVKQKALLQYIRKWADAELTETDSYLLFLALLNSTELVEWRTHAIQTPRTASIVSNNMEALARVISYANIIQHPSFVLPSIVIDKETQSLENANIWIADWMDCYYDFQQGNIKEREREKLKSREALLHTFIKNSSRPIAHYAKILADWAAEAGEFPKFPITVDSKSVSIGEYWKSIIIKCCKSESIFLIPSNDLAELISHCEDNIDHGSIYAHALMELLRAGAKRQQNYLGLGDLDISLTTYRIISAETSIEDANKQAMIDSAPDELPVPGNYPSKLAYLRAKLKYDMKVEHNKALELAAAIHANTTDAVIPESIVLIANGKEI